MNEEWPWVLAYIRALAVHKRKMALLAGLGVLLGVLAWRFTPTVYVAQASIVPGLSNDRTDYSAGADWADQLRLTLGGQSGRPNEFFADILRSRRIAEGVAARMRLQDLMPNPTGTREERERLAVGGLLGQVQVEVKRGGDFYMSEQSIAISATDASPYRAADVANCYVAELDRFVQDNSALWASQLRRFLERRLAETNRDLEEAQQELQEFQEQHGVASVDEQAKATVAVLSELEARRVGLEVELEAGERRWTKAHSELQALQGQLGALSQNIDQLLHSTSDTVAVRSGQQLGFYVPLARLPEIGFEASRRLLRVKVGEQALTFLRAQLEQAKVDEARNLPVVAVLDRAIPPWEPANPGPLVFVVYGLVLGLGCGVCLATAACLAERNPRAKTVADALGRILGGWRERLTHRLQVVPGYGTLSRWASRARRVLRSGS